MAVICVAAQTVLGIFNVFLCVVLYFSGGFTLSNTVAFYVAMGAIALWALAYSLYAIEKGQRATRNLIWERSFSLGDTSSRKAKPLPPGISRESKVNLSRKASLLWRHRRKSLVAEKGVSARARRCPGTQTNFRICGADPGLM